MRPELDRLRALLTDTITCLCRNGLKFDENICVQGLLGITLDNNDVFVVHINETLASGSNEAAAVDDVVPNSSEKQSSPAKPYTRQFSSREGIRVVKKHSRKSGYSSPRPPFSWRRPVEQPGESSSEDHIEDSTELIDYVTQQPQHWVTGTVDYGEPIVIKSELDADSAQYEQRLEVNAGRISATYDDNHDNTNVNETETCFSINEVKSLVPSVVSRPLQKLGLSTHVRKQDNHNLLGRQLNNGSAVSTGASTSRHSVSQNIYSGGYSGDGSDGDQIRGWNLEGHSIVGTNEAQEGTAATYLRTSSSSAVDIHDLEAIPTAEYDVNSSFVVPYVLNSSLGVQTFVCFCGRSFSHKPNFYRHRRKAHPEYHSSHYRRSNSSKFRGQSKQRRRAGTD